MDENSKAERKFRLVFEVQDLDTNETVVEKSQTMLVMPEGVIPSLGDEIAKHADISTDGNMVVWAAFVTTCRFIKHRMGVKPDGLARMQESLARAEALETKKAAEQSGA